MSPEARIPIEAKGILKIKGVDARIIKLNKVLFTENLSTNLLSLGRLCDQGFDILLTSTECFVIEKIRNLEIDPVLTGFLSKTDKL